MSLGLTWISDRTWKWICQEVRWGSETAPWWETRRRQGKNAEEIRSPVRNSDQRGRESKSLGCPARCRVRSKSEIRRARPPGWAEEIVGGWIREGHFGIPTHESVQFSRLVCSKSSSIILWLGYRESLWICSCEPERIYHTCAQRRWGPNWNETILKASGRHGDHYALGQLEQPRKRQILQFVPW